MSKQLSLDVYFNKSKSSVISPLPSKSIMNSDHKLTKVGKKRNLSLRKSVTPSKAPKVTPHKNDREVINLCSDEDDDDLRGQTSDNITPPKRDAHELIDVQNKEAASKLIANNDKKGHGIVNLLTYEDEEISIKNEFETPKKSDGNDTDSSQNTIIYSPQTPTKAQQTPTITAPSVYQSPPSANKYFSPNKKRAVFKKNVSVRKQLLKNDDEVNNDELFHNACLGLDDKTIFLLSIVNKCKNNNSLWRLLDEESQSLLLGCMHVVKPGMRLVCRLYWHKEGWYKKEKLKFILAGNEEIDDPTLHEVLQSLEENGFLTSDGNSLSFEEYTSLLNGDELKQICKELKIKISSKQGAIASLKSYSREKSIVTFFNTNKTNNNTSRVLRIMSSKAGPCYKLSDVARRTIYKLYILMYLGINYNIIREKNLELTLLYDKINRETYPVEDDMLDDASVVFRERAEFESYVKAFDVYEAFLIEDVLDKKIKTVTESFEVYKGTSEIEVQRQKSIPDWLRRYTPLNLYIKILESGIQDLKKIKDYQSALEILQMLISQDSFRQHKKAEWYAEMALVLQKCDQKEEAAEILLEGFRSNLSEEAKDVMRPRAKLVAKHTANQEMKNELLDYASKEQILEKNLRGVHIYKQPMDRTQKGKLKFETRQSGERTVQDVEEYCLSEYLNKGEFTNGMHWEGRIITTMFFLLFWDIIYWKPLGCVGVFLTRFQKLPLDLFCESFYKNRSESIEARLSLIERSSVEELLWIMQSKWCTRPETEHSGLSRDSMSWEQVCGVVTCLGGGALAALCRRLARDYRHAHSGFPDLTLWNTRTNQIRFVEVKSDTDRPSMKQIQWMHYLQQNGIDTEFCYVGVHTTRCKARSIS